MIHVRRGAAVALCAAAACAAAGCGSGSDDSSSKASGASGGSSAGKSFTVGWSEATGQNPWMVRIGTAAEPVIAAAGGKTEVGDAQLDPGKAVQQITRFMNEGVNSIIVAPAQVPNAVAGVLAKAHGQGIHVFGVEWSYSSNKTAPPKAPLDGQVVLDRGKLGREVSAQINHDFPNGAKVVYIGLPFPVVGVDFFEANMKQSLGKSQLIANLDNPKDNAQGALGPLNAALSAHPETNAIVTYNGPSALAAVQAVKSAGLAGKVKIYNIQLDTGTAAALKAGTIADAWDLNPPKLGQAAGTLISAAATGKPRSQWAKTVVVEPQKYDKSSIGSWTDWAKSG